MKGNENSDAAKIQSAAILIPVFENQNQLHLLFTKRSQSVRYHKGQVCFPGGVSDKSDLSLWHTALREVDEELGLKNHDIFYVGDLPPTRTPTAFHVKPFIGFIHRSVDLKPNPDEIDQVFSVPISYLLNSDNVSFKEHEYFGKRHPVPYIHYGEHTIWGVTGRIVLSLIERWR